MVRIRQRDQHEVARPDVQGLRVHAEAAVRRRRDRQLLVAVLDVGLREVEAVATHQAAPHGRERAVGAHDERGIDRLFASMTLNDDA